MIARDAHDFEKSALCFFIAGSNSAQSANWRGRGPETLPKQRGVRLDATQERAILGRLCAAGLFRQRL
jgi:hypothetical protein